jgi:hypothetical protein
MKVVDPAGRSAERMLGILWRIWFFFHVVLGSGDIGDLIQPRSADGASLVMVHEEFVGSGEIGFGSHHPPAEEVGGYQFVLSLDGALQSSCQGVQFFAEKAFHVLFLRMVFATDE